MSDIKIKDFGIFGNRNKGLDKIKREAEQSKSNEAFSAQIKIKTEKPSSQVATAPSLKLNTKIQSNRFVRGVGAPIQNHDQVFSAKQPLKLSAITVSLSRILSEKYMTESTRDEILRLSLNDYIKHNLTMEDKLDLLSDMEKEFALFREKYPTSDKYNEDGFLEKTREELESDTIDYLKDAWRLK